MNSMMKLTLSMALLLGLGAVSASAEENADPNLPRLQQMASSFEFSVGRFIDDARREAYQSGVPNSDKLMFVNRYQFVRMGASNLSFSAERAKTVCDVRTDVRKVRQDLDMYEFDFYRAKFSFYVESNYRRMRYDFQSIESLTNNCF